MLGLAGGAAAAVVLGACADDDGATASAPGGPRAPATTGASVPEPAGFVRTAWAEDPFALGAYSHLPVGATPEHRGTLATPLAGGRLHLTGEATWTENPATVHGARASGTRTAATILAASPPHRRVVVVGAGASGAAAARALNDGGAEVVVVEGRDRTGGRIATTRPDGWPLAVELGASWVHDVAASDLPARLGDLDVATAPFAWSASAIADRARLDGAVEAYARATQAIEDALAAVDDADEDVSIADAVAASGAATDDGMELALRGEVELEYGVDPDEMSAWWGMEEGSEGDDLIVLGGYGAVVDADLDGLDVRLGWTVAAVDVRGPSAAVRSADGEELEADVVVVTVPLAVLAAEHITFTPPLPATHRGAITAMGTGLLDKVWLRWSTPWWTEEAELWAQVGSPTMWCNLLPATGEPVLLALVGGTAARERTGWSDDQVRRAALDDLAAYRAAGW